MHKENATGDRREPGNTPRSLAGLIGTLWTTLPKAAPWYLCAFMGAGVSLVPAAFFIHFLAGSELNYFLMAQQIAKTGKHVASYAVNQPPFIYPWGVSYIYAPIMFFWETYQERLRAVHYLNIATIGVFFVLAIRYFRAAAPFANIRWFCLLFGITILADRRWLFSALFENADIVPAILTVAASLVVYELKRPPTAKIALLLLIGIVGFYIKFSLITIPVAFAFAEGRHWIRLTTRHLWVVAAALAVVAVLVFTNLTVFVDSVSLLLFHPRVALFGVSLEQALWHLAIAVTNLWFAAIPDQVIPNLHYLFVGSIDDDVVSLVPGDILTWRYVLGAAVGTVISVAVVIGAWRLWRHRPYDVISILLVLPVFAIVSSSTGRYLLPYKPFVWACLAYALRPLWPHFVARRVMYLRILAAAAIALLLVQARALWMVGRGSIFWLTHQQRTAIDDTAYVYGAALEYLDQQPADTTRLAYLEPPSDPTKWLWVAASKLPRYSPQTGFPEWARGYRVLAVVPCRVSSCQSLSQAREMAAKEVRNGCYGLRPVRQWKSPTATVEVNELVEMQNCSAAGKP